MTGETAALRNVRAAVQEALDRARATSDEEVRVTANAPASEPGSITKFSYALGLRDGVVMACEQILASIDDGAAVAPTPTNHHVHFEGGPWAGRVVQVERIVGPVFAVGDPTGNHYWLDGKSDPPTYVWDGGEATDG